MEFSASLLGIFGAALCYRYTKVGGLEQTLVVIILFISLFLEDYVVYKFSKKIILAPYLKAFICYVAFMALSYSFLKDASFEVSQLHTPFIFGLIPAILIYFLNKYLKI